MVKLLIGILINRITWEVKQLIAEFEKNQIKYELLNNQKVYYKLSNEKDLKNNFDLILERSLSYLRGLYSCAILETKGYKVINNFECLTTSGNKLLTTLKITTGVSTKRVRSERLEVLPFPFKLYLDNQTNVALAATGNILTAYTANNEFA